MGGSRGRGERWLPPSAMQTSRGRAACPPRHAPPGTPHPPPRVTHTRVDGPVWGRGGPGDGAAAARRRKGGKRVGCWRAKSSALLRAAHHARPPCLPLAFRLVQHQADAGWGRAAGSVRGCGFGGELLRAPETAKTAGIWVDGRERAADHAPTHPNSPPPPPWIGGVHPRLNAGRGGWVVGAWMARELVLPFFALAAPTWPMRAPEAKGGRSLRPSPPPTLATLVLPHSTHPPQSLLISPTKPSAGSAWTPPARTPRSAARARARATRTPSASPAGNSSRPAPARRRTASFAMASCPTGRRR